ncbi:MAG: enoyl-CoA hydratase-related protein [Elusimicrobiota bacterium]
MTQDVCARDEGFVRVVTLKRPPGNVLGAATLAALSAEIAAAAGAGGVRALVLTSGLPRYFSSGLDVQEIMSVPVEDRGTLFESLLGVYRSLLEFPKPVVGGLNGAAVLGGWVLAMACDWRILAKESGKISLSEIRLGLTPTPALVARLSGLSNDRRLVKEMVLRGASVRAEHALMAGLVDEVQAEAEVPARAVTLAKRLSLSAPRAFAAVKRSLNAAHLDEALWRDSLEEFRALVVGTEAGEGLAALESKRRPRWEGP